MGKTKGLLLKEKKDRIERGEGEGEGEGDFDWEDEPEREDEMDADAEGGHGPLLGSIIEGLQEVDHVSSREQSVQIIEHPTSPEAAPAANEPTDSESDDGPSNSNSISTSDPSDSSDSSDSDATSTPHPRHRTVTANAADPDEDILDSNILSGLDGNALRAAPAAPPAVPLVTDDQKGRRMWYCVSLFSPPFGCG